MIHDKWKAVAQMPNGYAIEDSKGRVIAMTQCDEDENDDNPITSQEEVEHANLIAASKDLLEALEVLIEKCLRTADTTLMHKELSNAQQAIKKAKGE